MSQVENGEAGTTRQGYEGSAPMSRSSMDSGMVESGEVVFSASMPVAFQGCPEDDWTLEARHTPLILGGQVRSFTMWAV